MEIQKIKVRSPKYMGNFKCLGNECEDTCCKYWRIDIDYDTYRKYIKISDPKIKYLVGEYVIKNRDTENKLQYATFKLKEDEHCAFLDENGLCVLQKNFGPQYLSHVCRTYPRRQVLLGDTLERSGTVSCPELARQMLFNNEPMQFEEFYEDAGFGYFWEKAVPISDAGMAERPLLKFLEPLRSLCIAILQNRSYSIRERLVLLGLFTNKLDTLNREEEWEEIQQHIDRYGRIIKGEKTNSFMGNELSDGYLQFKMIMDMIVARLKMARISPTFKAIMEQFKQVIGYYDGITMEQAYLNYKQIRAGYAEMFDQQYPQVFENYLVNYVFSKVYPLEPSKNVFENYIRLVVDYAITRLVLVGVGAYHKKYDDEIVQKVFTGVALTVDHNTEYVDKMVNNIQQISGGALAYTALLIQM